MTELAENRDPPAHSRRSVHIARLHEIASNLSEEYEEKGLVGYRVLWEFDQIAIHEDLEEWYDREMVDLEENRLSPETFELRFGRARIPGEGGKGSRDEPFQLRNGHEVFRFQGRADRVDTAPDRSRFRVIDYKTGQSNYYQKETLNGGRSLQLPIYLLATADLLDIPWVPSQAQYFFPTRRGEFKRVELTGRWLAENQESLVELLREISGAISQGVFPQIPVIKRTKNCRNCDFQDVCPVGVERIAQRKRNDERVYQLRQAIGAEA